MSKHGGTFNLSGETRDLLKENQAFFEEVLGLYDPQDPEKLPLKFKSGDPESRSEAKVQPNGEVEVSFLVPLDSDADPENGRIYLRDSFVFDPSEKKLKSYQRSFDYNGKGQGPWADWLQKYRDTLKSNPRNIDDPVVQTFAFSAGTSFGRALTDENGATLPEFSQAYKRQHDYLDTNHHMVEMNLQELGYKLKDKLNHYTVVLKDDQIHITFHIAIDGDDDPSNGRLILSDTISVDAKTWELKNFTRNWKPAPAVAEFDDWKATAERMNQIWADTDANEKKKLGELGRAFVYNMASLLMTGNDVKLEEVKPEDAFSALIAARAKTGPVEISAFAKRLQKDPRRGEATVQILEAIGVLTNESLSQRHDSELGWWNSKILHHTPIDIERVQKANAAVLAKSLEAAAGKSTATAFEVLQSLTLEGDEAVARDRILANKVAVELNSIGAEADPELRAIGLLHFADQRLFRRLSMPLSAQTILAGLESSPFVQDKARAVLATMGGKGTFGDKFEYFLPKFAKQIANPATLIAMGGAPFLGAAAEGLGLAGISRFGSALGGTGRVNFAGRWLAGAFGLSGEAFAFTALHQAGASAVHDPDKVLANFGNEFKSGLLLFGAMRAAHAGVNPLTARIFTKNPVEAELLTSPTGRILLNPRWGGGQANWFSRNIAMPTVNHGTGIVAMHLANSLSRRWELMPNDGQDQWSHFLESALSYGQAVAGFNLANRLTLGRLQSTLGEAKLRLDALGKNQMPIGKRSRQVSNSPQGSRLNFTFNGNWTVDARRTKSIWVGSIPGRRPGVEYEDGFAKINVGNENTVSEWHAVLVRDKSDSYWFAADAGSTYGTFLNNKRLEPGEHTRFKNGSVLQLGDSYQLRIDVDGKLMTPPDPLKTQVVVDVPHAPPQKRLGPPTIADAFPFEMLYPGYEVPAGVVVEVAQLRQAQREPMKLTSASTGWGNAKSAHLYVDKKGRFVFENLSYDSPIEVHRPAKGEKKEERWILQRYDKKTALDEQKALGRQDWVFLETGDKISFGKQEMEFVAHDLPVGEKIAETARSLGHSDPPPPPNRSAKKSVPPEVDADRDSDSMSDRVTLVDIQPASKPAAHSDNSEITQALRPKLTNVERLDGPLPPEYIQDNNIPDHTPVFELLVGGRRIRSDRHSSRYLIGRDPDTSNPYQSSITVAGRLLEQKHAEIFLSRTPDGSDWQWYLTDLDSTYGTFLGGKDGRRLDSGAGREYVPLNSGSTFSLGAVAGKNDAVEFTFKLPWAATTSEPAKAASVFPAVLVERIPADQAPMELVDNFGNLIFSADRKTTRYIFGRNPDPRETPNTRIIEISTDKRIGDEHCEIFVDDSGQWYLRSLTLEEKTYIDGEEVIPGATIPISPENEIALGGDAKNGHGMTFMAKSQFVPARQAKPARPSSVPPEVTDPEGEMPTVRPEAPGKTPPRPRPRALQHIPPRRETTADIVAEFDPNITQVMRTGTAEELARRSLEVDDSAETPLPVNPLPTPGPNVIRRTNPPLKPAIPPPAPAADPKPATAEPASAAERDAMDWSDIDTSVPEGFQFKQPQQPESTRRPSEPPANAPPPSAPSDGMPPPSSEAVATPVIPRNSPLPYVAPLADPALTAIHPDLRSHALLQQARIWLKPELEHLKPDVQQIKAFPRHEVDGHTLKGSTETLPLFLSKILKAEISARSSKNSQIAVFAEGTKSGLSVFANPQNALDYGQVFNVTFDAKSLRYFSEDFNPADSNTVLSAKIRKGGEADMIRGLHQKLLGLDVPVEFIVPLVEGGAPTYLSIKYRAQDAIKVHQAVREFAAGYPEALDSSAMPLTQPLKGLSGEPIPGVGVMDFVNGEKFNPLELRFRALAMAPHVSYVKAAQAAKTYSEENHLVRSIQAYKDAGYDLIHPGFHHGSLESTHNGLLLDLYPQD